MIDADALLRHDFGETRQSWTARDAIIYALGVGLGSDPLDPEDLRYLDERELRVLPTFAVTLASPGMWIREPRFDVDFHRLVHLAQYAEFLASLPAEGTVVGTAEITSLTDRGPDKGAILVLERTITDARSGTVYCRMRQTILLRGDGGFGGARAERKDEFAFDSSPDVSAQFATSPRAALLYRLSGDLNPLHLDPAIAKRAGFEAPILHGLASYAAAGIAASRSAGKSVAAIKRLGCRFSGIILPGDMLRVESWHDEPQAHFRTFIGDRKVLDNGIIAWGSA